MSDSQLIERIEKATLGLIDIKPIRGTYYMDADQFSELASLLTLAREHISKLEFMIENGLGHEDFIDDVSLHNFN